MTATRPATPASAPAQYGQYGAPSAPRQTFRRTAPALDSAAFLMRCAVLAHAAHRDADEAVYAGQDARSGAMRYRVASSRIAGLVYDVTYTPAPDTERPWRCNCQAGATRHPCQHTGVAYAAFTAAPPMPAPVPSAREQVRAGMERELRSRIATLQRQASDMSDDIADLIATWNRMSDRGVASAETLARLDADISHEQARRRALITTLQSDRAQLAALALESTPLALV